MHQVEIHWNCVFLNPVNCFCAVFGGTAALVSICARMISVLAADDEGEKLQELSEQIDRMQTTQAAMREEILNLQQHGQP